MTPTDRLTHACGLAVAYMRRQTPLGARLAAELDAALAAFAPRAAGPAVDMNAGTVSHGGRTASLPRQCLRLLDAFVRSDGRCLTRDDLFRAGWGEPDPSSARLNGAAGAVRQAVHRLRISLQSAGFGDVADGLTFVPSVGGWRLDVKSNGDVTGEPLDGGGGRDRLSTERIPKCQN